MKNRLLRTTTPLVGALLAALTLGACGAGHEKPITRGELEAVNVVAGDLVYQVQISRALNPLSVDDEQYLRGVAEPDLTNEQQWFGVWVRAENFDDVPHESTEEFKVLDAAGNEYEPEQIAEFNPFKYSARVVEEATGNGQPLLPDPESASGTGPIQGSMLLFKVPYTIYQNSPVELEIVPTEGGEASTVKLDM